MVRVTEMPAAQAFPAILTIADAAISRTIRFRFDRAAMSSRVARRMRRHCRVNTSLSGTLFFSMCWCIRDVVHFDSRVHAAIKPSH
jgi:hypothetical protein